MIDSYLVEEQDEIDAESQNQGHVLERVKVTSKETDGLSDIFTKIHLWFENKKINKSEIGSHYKNSRIKSQTWATGDAAV